MTIIISDKQQQEYAGFMAETLSLFESHDIKGIAIVALTGEETLTGYWNMCLKDKSIAESEIRYDVIDGLILANKDRYFSEEV